MNKKESGQVMNHPLARRLSSTMEPEDRFIRILREMDPAGEMTREINEVEREVKLTRKAARVRRQRRRYKALPKTEK